MHNQTREAGLWDRLVNNKWNGEQPILTDKQSLRAAKLLYRKAMGRAWRGKWQLTSGRRYTWPRRGVFKVNPDMHQGYARGLRALIHDMSHYCHSRLHPKDAPHSARQAYIERDLTDYALSKNLFRD